MFYALFKQAMAAPIKQRGFRWIVAVHLGLFLPCLWWASFRSGSAALSAGYLLITAGIVEGAMLLGWRLTQLPKSQSLEFLLVSPVRPPTLFLAEALVGLSRLGLVTLAGLPFLVLFVAGGFYAWTDLLPLLIMPLTWGALAGVGLTSWAYEALWVRRWGERVMVVLIVVYLVVGVLAGEHLGKWIGYLPRPAGLLLLNSLEAFHRYNPFAVMQFWLTDDPFAAWQRFWAVELAALLILALLLGRAAARLRGHFDDRHYRPVLTIKGNGRGAPGDHPLAWWAVRRVTEYSGRVNLWLAGGFGLLYAAYTIAGRNWPSWLGREVFRIFDTAGGVPVWAAALVVLASVPAAFQYGLWDSNAQDRCRRLELLLLTRLEGMDYWQASLHAAWRRGRGYFMIALVLWMAGFWAGSLTLLQTLAGMACGIVLWALYFTLGFRSFAHGSEGGRLGLVLTVGFPLVTYMLGQFGWTHLAAVLPPGGVYYGARIPGTTDWMAGALIGASACLILGRQARAKCAAELRRWYDLHHGQKLVD
jgi:hypothetical protein